MQEQKGARSRAAAFDVKAGFRRHVAILPGGWINWCRQRMRETASRRCRPTVRLRPVGHIDIRRLGHRLPDGRMLLEEVSFRVGDGAKVALVGATARARRHC